MRRFTRLVSVNNTANRIHFTTRVTPVTTISYEISQTRHVSVRCLPSSFDVRLGVLLLLKPCVFSLCRLTLYIYTILRFPRFTSRASLVNSYWIPVTLLRYSSYVFRFCNVISLISRLSTRTTCCNRSVFACFSLFCFPIYSEFIHLCVIYCFCHSTHPHCDTGSHGSHRLDAVVQLFDDDLFHLLRVSFIG
jgi:hypothetical protein